MRQNPFIKNTSRSQFLAGGKSPLFNPGAMSRAFTLVEMLVATAVLVLILTLTLRIISYASTMFLSTRKRIDTFQEARAGFEVMTRKISQAMLNTYWDYTNGTVGSGTGVPRPPPNTTNGSVTSQNWFPTQYLRASQLHFVTGQAVQTTSGSANVIIASSIAVASPPVTKMVGQAIFFQAPVGYSDTVANSVLPSVMNSCGYFLEFSSDNPDRPIFLTGSETGVTPKAGGDSLPVKFRFRLKEFNLPSEYMYVYSYITNPTLNNFPALISLNWWFSLPLGKQNLNQGSLPFSPIYTLSQNVIALVIQPMRSPNYPVPTGAPIELAPFYFYDSRSWDMPAQLTNALSIATRNQLPPQVRVTMVAIDEASAARQQVLYGGTTGSGMPTFADSGAHAALTGGLYNSSGVAQIFNQASVTAGSGFNDKYQTDLANLEQALVNLHITYRVFSTNVSILQAKFSD